MKKILIYLSVSLIIIISFYKYMTYDRNYRWSKDFYEDVIYSTDLSDYKFQKEEEIKANLFCTVYLWNGILREYWYSA